MTQNASAPVYIHGIGTAVPETWLDSDGSADLLRHACASPRGAKLVQRIARLTGIERRHLVALDHSSRTTTDGAIFRPSEVQPHGPGMGARTDLFEREAAPLVLRALSPFAPERLAGLDALVTVSCTHASSPGLERPILANTPVPPNVDRWNLGFMGCSAGLAGLRLVHGAAATRRESLVVACELSSLHFQYTDALDQMTANVLFADGAAAMLLSPEPGAARVITCRSVALPELADQMIWYAGDYGLKLRLAQDLPETLAAHLPRVVAEFLQDHGLKPGRIDHWLVHPGGPQILDAVESSLGLAPDALHASRDVLRRFGNMSSPTIFFIMRDVFASGAHGHAVAMAFGPGLTIELALLYIGPEPA